MSSISQATARVAVIGNPNTGKSTLFVALTGAKSRVANYPGATVEKVVARVHWHGKSLDLIDLPGAYSLAPRSLDEMVAVDVLTGQQGDIGALSAVVCVLDASHLERNLYLVSQLLELQLPLVLVLNMWDTARKREIQIDVDSLGQQLGVRIATTTAHRGEGIEQVKQAVVAALDDPPLAQPRILPEAMLRQCQQIGDWIEQQGVERPPDYIVQRLVVDVDGYVQRRFATLDGLPRKLDEARSDLARQGLKAPVAETDARYAWARGVVNRSVLADATRPYTPTDRLDAVLTHRVLGLLIFGLLMFVVFQSIYRFADPITLAMEMGQNWIKGALESLMPPGAFRSLLTNGVVDGVGGVVTFVPQIAFLFFFIALLEDCGYMARAAYIMDVLMAKVGLSGKSFIPLMSSFACAIPGVMAARVIEDRRDRLATVLVAPLMSCSARLPVYLLMIRAFLPQQTWLNGWLSLHGLVLLAMMSLGALVAIPVAWVLKKTLLRGPTPAFVMELPEYKVPSARMVLFRVYDRSRAFVVRAGTLIFAATILVWAAGYFPADRSELNRLQAQREGWTQFSASLDSPSGDGASEGGASGDEASEALENGLRASLLEQSLLGRLGKVIEPLVKPLGWDWRIGVGVLASFPAREVIISAMGTIFSLGGDVDEESTGLQDTLRDARWPDGRPLFGIATALSIMVFFALCAQCVSTLITIRRETGAWSWAVLSFVYMTVLAYFAAWGTYAAARWLGG